TERVGGDSQSVLESCDNMSQRTNDLLTNIQDFVGLALSDSEDMKVIEMAKSDHMKFVGRIFNTLIEADNLNSAEIPDCHHCNFGKWYDAAAVDSPLRSNEAFISLQEPHRHVHDLGKKIVQLHETGSNKEARNMEKDLTAVSETIYHLLTELTDQVATRIEDD
ncbi:MAG: CZB domain-containing protein, partial [Pseudomonadota bacterium]|nr:CZB domain-containing protein [Pseudomonadota bacterium]